MILPTNPEWSNRGRQTIVAILLAGVLLIGTSGIPLMAAQDAPEPSFVVSVDSDGSATVTIMYTFDLTSDAEAAAFQTLQNDVSAREDLRTRFLDRLRSVASAAADRTERSMAVTDATIDLGTAADGQIGVATLRATWDGLARVDGDRLVITEPFTSEFTPDRRFVIRAPDGYTVASATPSPADRESTSVTWRAGGDLSEFEVVLSDTGDGAPTDDGVDSTESGGQPGFGVFVALIALGLLAVGVGRQRRTA